MESTQTGDALTVDQAAQVFKGLLGAKEPPKTGESKEVKPETKAEATEVKKPEEDVQKAEEQDAEAEKEGAEKSESEKEDKGEQTDAEIQLESLEELAEATGLPLEKILSLKARTKVDGIENAVSLAEIVKGYQLDGHLTRKSQELADKLKAADVEREKITTELNSRLMEANQLIGHFEQQFMAEYNAINWNELRQADPAEFAAKKQEYNDRWNQLQSYRQQVISNAQKVQQETQQKAQDKLQDYLKTEEEKLYSKFPDWKDPEKAKVGKKEVSEYLMNYGFKPEEVSQIYDHRQVDIIRKAMLYDKQSTKTDIAKKKVVVLPKILKPSSSQKTDPKADAIRESLDRLSKSGKVEDAAEVFKIRLRKK